LGQIILQVVLFVAGIEYACEYNVTSLLNGAHTYRGCANDSLNNIGCSELRTININRTLPAINLTFPLNNSKHSTSDIIFMNVTTDLIAQNIWCNVDGTSLYNLTNISLYNWTNSTNLVTGYYNITCSGNDTIGNILTPITHYFLILPDKNIKIEKSIKAQNSNNYVVNLNFTNSGKWEDHFSF